MKNTESVTNSFSASLLKRRKEGDDFESNLRTIRRLYRHACESRSLSCAEIIHQESTWTDSILKLLADGNSKVLHSFQHLLQMEEKEEYLVKQGMRSQQDEL